MSLMVETMIAFVDKHMSREYVIQSVSAVHQIGMMSQMIATKSKIKLIF